MMLHSIVMDELPDNSEALQKLCILLLVDKCGGGDVIDMCCLHFDGGHSMRYIASLYNLHVSQVWRAISRSKAILIEYGVFPDRWALNDKNSAT